MIVQSLNARIKERLEVKQHMPSANIIFPDLRAEMARQNITIQDIANVIKTGRDTAGAKLSGKRPLHLDEAIAITDTFFPHEDVRQLFKKE